MSIRRYKDVFSGHLPRLVGKKWANSTLGIIHQAWLPPDYVLLLPLQHDSGIDKGRIALTQREGTSEHERRRLVVVASHLRLASMHEGGRVLKDYTLSQLPESRSITERWNDGSLVQQENFGPVTFCEILFLMLMMDTQCNSLQRSK